MRYPANNPPLVLFTLFVIPHNISLFIIMGKLTDKAIRKMKEAN